MVNFVTYVFVVPHRLVLLANKIMEKFGEDICMVENIAGKRSTHDVEIKVRDYLE